MLPLCYAVHVLATQLFPSCQQAFSNLIKTAAVRVSSRLFLSKLRAPWKRKEKTGSQLFPWSWILCIWHKKLCSLISHLSWRQKQLNSADLVFMFRSRRSFKFFSILPLAGNKSDFSVTEYPGRISIWISTYRNNAFSSVSKQFLLRERASHQNIYKHKQLDESFPRQTFQWENLGNRSFSKTLPPPSPPSEPETLIYLTLLDRWFAEA